MKSLWEGNSELKALAESLHSLIPQTGAVENPEDNPKLEKLRIAFNCYYDLYNNGLLNRRKEFRKLFKINSTTPLEYDKKSGEYTEYFLMAVESKMEVFIRDAASEQENH